MQTSVSRDRSKAFTLVEMAIVMVVLGLIVGAIIAGQNLVRNSKITGVLTEAKAYAMAIQQFREKYGQRPGDFSAATQVWGRLNGNADCVSNTGAATDANGTCDGDGSGSVDYASGVNRSGETFQVWRQLALAGLITGNYTGLNGPVATWGTQAIPGTNTPRSGLDQTTFFIQQWSYFPASTTFYEGDYVAAIVYGKIISSDWPRAPALTGGEAFNLDKKVDDGLPGAGTIRTMARTWLLANNGVSCTSSDTAASATYTKGDTSPTCFLLFMNNFQVSSQQGTFAQP